MWDLPGPGIEPVSTALAGGFFTTKPPETPGAFSFNILNNMFIIYLAVPGLRCCGGSSLAVASGSCSLVAVRGLLCLWRLLLVRSTGSGALGLPQLQLLGSRAQAQ